MTFLAFVLIIGFLIYQNGRLNRLEQILKNKTTHVQETSAESASVISPTYSQEIENKEESSSVSTEVSSGKIIGFIGIFAVVIGIAFFLKYAFENNWIQPLEIVLVGILVGISLIFIGQWLRQKYLSYSDLLMGGGLFVCYLSIFASYGFYHLVGASTAFGAMIFITAVGVIISIINATKVLSVIAFIGGFVSPLLFNLDIFSQVWSLYIYITILNIGIFALLNFKRWMHLAFIGLFGTFILFLSSSGWSDVFSGREVMASSVVFLTIQYLIITASGFIKLITEKINSSKNDHILMSLTALLFIIMFGTVLMPGYKNQFCLVLLAFSALYLVLSIFINKHNPSDRVLNIILPGLATIFFTVAIPIKYSGSVLATFWLLESVVLYLIASKVSSRGFQIMGACAYVLGLFGTFFYVLFDYQRAEKFSLIFNSHFGMLFLAVVVSYAVAFVYYKYGSTTAEIQRTGINAFLVLANFLTLWALSAEVVAYHNVFGSSSGKNLSNVSNVSVSILWAVYAVTLTVIGFVNKYTIVRRMGLALFMLTAFKVLIIDVWDLGDVYRIVSFLTFGLICLIASYLYVKFKDRL